MGIFFFFFCPGGDAIAPVWFLPCLQILIHFSESTARPVLAEALMSTREDLLQSQRRCGFSTQRWGGSPRTQWGRCSSEILPKAWKRYSCWSPDVVGRNHVPLMSFDILICFLSSPLPPPRNGSSTSVLWVLLERNRFLQPWPIRATHTAFHNTWRPHALLQGGGGFVGLWQSPAPVCANSYPSHSSGTLKSPFRLAGLLHILSCLYLNVGQVYYWLLWILRPYQACLFLKAQVRKNPLRSLSFGCWVPHLPPRHYCLWMDI